MSALTGNYLSSQDVSIQVLSAYKGLTSVFGMGTGGTPQPNHRQWWGIRLSRDEKNQVCHPEVTEYLENRIRNGTWFRRIVNHIDQALDLLVSVSYMCYHTSTSDLSTWQSSRGLTPFTDGRSYLEVGFTLRCLQRLSAPHLATKLCRWHDN